MSWLTSTSSTSRAIRTIAAAAMRSEQRETPSATRWGAWLADHPGVEATQTSSCAPEQWEGVVDGRSFYFRERDGLWSVELDLEPDGSFANRFVGTDPDGQMITEPVELRFGPQIASGDDSDLGSTLVEHIEFIVRTIRDHIKRAECLHERAEAFCPTRGSRSAL